MRTLAEMSCDGLEWTRPSVQPQLGIVQREDTGSIAVYAQRVL
jgi:hypothetical protein